MTLNRRGLSWRNRHIYAQRGSEVMHMRLLSHEAPSALEAILFHSSSIILLKPSRVYRWVVKSIYHFHLTWANQEDPNLLFYWEINSLLVRFDYTRGIADACLSIGINRDAKRRDWYTQNSHPLYPACIIWPRRIHSMFSGSSHEWDRYPKSLSWGYRDSK
jgi:hypothetical protein